MKSTRYPARQIALIACMAATLFAAKEALNLLPNIEAVTLLIIVYTLGFGRRTLWAALIFVALECLIWPIQIWSAMYLYIWPLLVLLVYSLRNTDSVWFWCLISAAYGLLFGLVCAVPYLFLGGLRTAIGWWIAGIPFDLLHAAGNFCLCMILFKPLMRLMKKIAPAFREEG